MSYDSGRKAGLSESVSLHYSDDAFDEISELLERFENRLTFSNWVSSKRAVAEGYINGSLNLIIEARWGTVDFGLVLNREDAPKSVWRSGVDHERDAVRPRTEKPDVAIWSHKHSGNANLCSNLNGCSSYRYDGVVLVDDVEHVQDVERRVNSIACFKPKEEPLGRGTDAIYFSNRSGLIAVRSLVDRQPTAAIRLTAVRTDQVTNEVIQNAPKVMNGVTDERAESDWNRFLNANAEDILSSIRVYLVGQSVKVAVLSSEKERLKIVNVAFGPFDF